MLDMPDVIDGESATGYLKRIRTTVRGKHPTDSKPKLDVRLALHGLQRGYTPAALVTALAEQGWNTEGYSAFAARIVAGERIDMALGLFRKTRDGQRVA